MTPTILNPVAVTSAPLLRAIEAGGWDNLSDLAKAAGRDPRNVTRDLATLETAALILMADPAEGSKVRRPRLTDDGKAQLAAIARAEHGGEKRRARGRCPVDKIIPNPGNREVKPADVAARADTIEAAKDVLQPVILAPPDANGVRMLLAGEHRWRAVLLLAEQGRLPDALAEGIPFVEREADAAEQILIRIVENTGRADLSPLDDARQLLALQEATKWSAREIAKKTGRSPADSDTGVRDVQVKIKVAREATSAALAEYERDGSWDRLRDSVTEKKPTPAPALVVAAVDETTRTIRNSYIWSLGQLRNLAPDPSLLRREDPDRPNTAELIRPGQVVQTSYGTGPYRVVSVKPHSYFESYTAWSLVLRDLKGGKQESYINEVVVDWEGDTPRFRHLFKANPDEVLLLEDAQSEPVYASAWTEAEALECPHREAHHEKPAITIRLYRPARQAGDLAEAPAWAFSREAQVGPHRLGQVMDLTRDPDQTFPTRAAALAAAVKWVRRDYGADLPQAYAEWMDGLQGPHYVNGVDRLNASNAGEARRALGWDKRQSNSGGRKGPAPTPPFVDPDKEAEAQEHQQRLGLTGRPDLVARADRMAEAARDGAAIVLVAAITEIVEAAESHLNGLRRTLEQAGQDLTEFEDDTAHLRETMTQALDALEGLGLGEGEGLMPLDEPGRPLNLGEPFVPVRKSITPEHITCLYDGRRFAGGLRRHLLTRYNETPDEYRRKWGLPADYPMIAPNHAKRQHDALRATALKAGARS